MDRVLRPVDDEEPNMGAEEGEEGRDGDEAQVDQAAEYQRHQGDQTKSALKSHHHPYIQEK